MKRKERNESKIRRCIKTPIRALSWVRDFYVESMNSFANRLSSRSGKRSNLPKSFSINSSWSSRNDDEDFRELLRIASAKNLSRHKVIDNNCPDFIRPQNQMTTVGATKVVPRSQSAVIGRIDENIVCVFDDADITNFKASSDDMFSRSRSSYSVGTYKNKLLLA